MFKLLLLTILFASTAYSTGLEHIKTNPDLVREMVRAEVNNAFLEFDFDDWFNDIKDSYNDDSDPNLQPEPQEPESQEHPEAEQSLVQVIESEDDDEMINQHPGDEDIEDDDETSIDSDESAVDTKDLEESVIPDEYIDELDNQEESNDDSQQIAEEEENNGRLISMLQIFQGIEVVDQPHLPEEINSQYKVHALEDDDHQASFRVKEEQKHEEEDKSGIEVPQQRSQIIRNAIGSLFRK